MASNRKTEKAFEQLRELLKEEKYYEAQQMYRTTARRYNKQLKYTDTIRLLHDGAVLLLQHKKYSSGSDLAKYMLETYELAKTPVDEVSLDRIVEILNLLPSSEQGRRAFIRNAIKWTQTNGEYPEGDPELHDFIGTMFYNEEKYKEAEDHLLLGTDHSAELTGKMAYGWASQEDVHSKGIYLARVVLQFLVTKNIRHAVLAHKSFITASSEGTVLESLQVRHAPADEPVPFIVYEDSWINFTSMLLLTVQRDGAHLFKELDSNYQYLYRHDPKFVELVQDIGFVFFNIPKPRKQGNMLQDMMANLFGGGASGASNPLLTLGGGAPSARLGEDLD